MEVHADGAMVLTEIKYNQGFDRYYATFGLYGIRVPVPKEAVGALTVGESYRLNFSLTPETSEGAERGAGDGETLRQGLP